MKRDILNTVDKSLSKKDIDLIFKEIKSEKIIIPIPIIEFEKRNPSDTWVITSGSSKSNNKLIEVSTWQIGQIY